MVIVANNEVNFKQSLSEKAITLVEFGAVWCPPCKVLLPILDELDRDNEGRVSILEVDVDEQQGIASEFGIMSVPTVIVFHNGEPVDKLVGLRPKDVYQKLIARYS
jgi:thioredoxin 1